MNKIGIVIPSYNETECISSLLVSIRNVIPDSFIVVVDDSPSLETVQIVEQLNLTAVIAHHRQKKDGRGSAVLKGIEIALQNNCSKIIEMDADFSHPPSQLLELIKKSEELHLDLLIASRYLADSEIVNWPLTRRIFSKASNWLAHLFLQVPIHDYTNGYRCYSQAGAKHITLTCGQYGKGFIALSEILVNLYYSDFKVGEVPTRFVNRVRGESSLNFQEIKNAFWGLFKIYALKRKLLKGIPHGSMAKSRR